LPAEPVFPTPLSAADLAFALTVFALFFFSLLASVWAPADFGGLDLGCADDLVAFTSIVFPGVDSGVAFGFGVAFGTGVSIGVGFGKSISLFA
jgi:hypothetical protein